MAAPGFLSVSNFNPAEYAAAVTPSDSTDLGITRFLWVGGTGDVVVVMAGDAAAVTLASVPSGSLLPIRVTKVKAATSATNIVALY